MKLRRSNPNSAPVPLTDDDIARALTAQHDSLLPSSGFSASVMAAIAHEAIAPAPIPFPWKRALPGMAAVVLVLALLIAVLVSMAFSAPVAPAPTAPTSAIGSATLFPFLHSTQDTNIVVWTAVAIGISIASFAFLRRLITSH